MYATRGVNNVILHNTLDKNKTLSRGDAPILIAARSQSSEDVPTNSPSSNKNWDERLSGISQTVQHDQHMRQASTESPQVSSHIVDPSEIVRAHTATLCPMDVEISSSVCGDSVNSGLVEGTYTRHGTQNFSTQEVPFIDVNKTLIRERASLVTNDSQCNAASFASEEEPGNQRINLHRSAGEEHLNREPKNGDDGYHGEHGAGLSSAEDWWLATSSEQLHAFSGVSSLGGTVNSTSSPGTEIGKGKTPVNRAHMSEFIHFEREAQGIDTPGSDLPEYQWELDDPELSLNFAAGAKNVNERKLPQNTKHNIDASGSTSCYIPKLIRGSPQLKVMITAVCSKHIKVFNTKLSEHSSSNGGRGRRLDMVCKFKQRWS